MQIGSRNFDFIKPVIMGIINVTPDSFYDGGNFLNFDRAVNHAKKLISEGVDILDIGGESTRPGSKTISAKEEAEKVIPLIKTIREFSEIPISIDTQKSYVAAEALNAGADMINDISAGTHDGNILKLAAKEKVPVCLMHMRGKPINMQDNTHYDNLIAEIFSYLKERIDAAEQTGVTPDKIIIDPGIGFGKSAEDNINLIKNLNVFSKLNKPILIGTSRKSFIGKTLGLEPQERLEATLATLSKSYDKGARIFRVHDVCEASRFLSMHCLLSQNK